MKRWMAWAAFLVLGMAGPAWAAGPGPEGYWIGPHGNVAVRTAGCGDKLCGWVVWADPAARVHAAGGGTPRLVGIQLLSDYVVDGAHAWSGTVFVPDLGRRFASRIEQVSADRLRVQGCILGGLICRAQTWTRIDRPPTGA